MRRFYLVGIVAAGLAAAGCAGMKSHGCKPCAGGDGPPTCDYDPEAKTLFNWAVCKEDEKKGESGNAEDKSGNGEEKRSGNGEKVGYTRTQDGLIVPVRLALDEPPANGNGSTNGATKLLTGNGNGGAGAGAGEPDTITTDRPDFTEASTTVGKGRIQLEAGYTYSRDRASGTTTNAHSYPEILLRIGMFADWFEWRIGQNFGAIRSRGPGGPADTLTGANDLYLGSKIALTEQKGVFPEMAVIFQTTVPTGSRVLTGSNNKVLPGISLLYSWDLTEKVSLAGSVLGNKAVDDDGHAYTEFANSISVGYSFTDKVGGYFEYFGFYPHSAVAAGVTPQLFMNGGFTYLMTNDLQFDVRAGFGLNRAADDFFTGAGFAYRY